MKIDVRKEDGKKWFILDGRLDTTAAPQLGSVLEEELKDDVKEVVIDMDRCGYVASSGLRVILQAQKSMNRVGGSMVVKNVNETVMEVFEMTGFSSILTIE
ncbi:MAG: STAS domain-containing protein [Lachnospiraceae bacterium]|nr:STAS domain-containing protein [Lachnospiraceae bacterium]